MKKTRFAAVAMALAILALLMGTACAESILPLPQTPPPIMDEEVISLEAVTRASRYRKDNTEEGGLLCYYSGVSYQCYERFGVKLGEEGFSLVSGETREDGTIVSTVTNGAFELIIEYEPENEYARVTYPPHAFPRESIRYEDYVVVRDGDAVELFEGVTATIVGWEKVDSYSYYEIDTNWIPSKRYDYTKETGEDGQMALITFKVDYSRLDDHDIYKLLRSPVLECGEDRIDIKYGRMVNERQFRWDNDTVSGAQEFTWLIGFALTEEQLERLDKVALTFTDWYGAVPYVYFLEPAGT